MDKGSIGGVILAIAGIIAGLLIEGGKVSQILQPTAALIVFGGTMGAVLLQFPLSTVKTAFRSLGQVFVTPQKRMPNSSISSFHSRTRRGGMALFPSTRILPRSRTRFSGNR